MKHIRFFTNGLLVASVCFALGSCSDEDFLDLEQNNTQNEQTTHTIPMEFVGDVVGFDQQSNGVKVHTRTTTSSWTNGDKIYITFYNGSNIVPGEATYNSSSGWSVSYDGNLATGSNLKCEARYFVNATFSSSSLVSLNSNTEIYEDLNGTYAYNNGSLTVQASLTPKTGRIRFTGSSGAKIYTTGISVYTTFAPAINQFSTSSAMITSTVASNGSTPYIYGTFTDSDRNIGLIGSDFAYTRTCTSDMLKVGESGYMAIPSESSHNNWRSGLYVKASGVEFKMIPVAGYSSGFFLIGETEVTEALYNSIDGSGSSSLLPKSYISFNSMLSFIEKLNNSTKLSFKLPSSGQWKYAATGGKKSQNYAYAGSNTLGDVAWYTANSSSKQNVKTKAPNELGIYDMSGNVAEMTTEVYSSGTYYYYNYYGGSYSSSSSNCQITKSNGYLREDDVSTTVGFRLILTCQ